MYQATQKLGLLQNDKYDSLEDIIIKADSFDLGLLDCLYAKLQDYHPEDFANNERSAVQKESDDKTV